MILEKLYKHWKKIWLVITVIFTLIFIFYIVYYFPKILKDPFLLIIVIAFIVLMPIAIIRTYYGPRLIFFRKEILKEEKSDISQEYKNYLKLTIMALIIIILFTIIFWIAYFLGIL